MSNTAPNALPVKVFWLLLTFDSSLLNGRMNSGVILNPPGILTGVAEDERYLSLRGLSKELPLI